MLSVNCIIDWLFLEKNVIIKIFDFYNVNCLVFIVVCGFECLFVKFWKSDCYVVIIVNRKKEKKKN